MTRKNADPQPALAVRPRATTGQSVQASLTKFCNDGDCSPNVSASVSAAHQSDHYPSVMYRFGSEIDDPASYSRSPPLRPAMHFTPAPQPEDDQMPENLLSKNMSEELVNSGLYDYFPETFADEVFVNALRELELQTDEICKLLTRNSYYH